MTDGDDAPAVTSMKETCRICLSDGHLICSYRITVPKSDDYPLKFPRFVPEAMMGVCPTKIYPLGAYTTARFDFPTLTLHIAYSASGQRSVDLTLIGRWDVSE